MRRFSRASAVRFTCTTLATLGAMLLPYSVAPAEAETRCVPRGDALNLLLGKYQELRAAGGVDRRGGLVEVWSTTNGSTWTLTLTTPEGRTCVLSAGKDWHRVPQVSLDPEA